MMDESKNPWKVLSKKAIYDNNWISVTEFQVINPNGGEGIYGKVHYKNIAIGILPLDAELNTYLVGQYRFPIDRYSWEIPEGGGSPDHDPLDSAKRELREETGLIAHTWKQIQTIHLSNSVSDEYGIVFLARDLEQHDPKPEETEQLTIKKLPFDEVCDMVLRGTITDSITVATVLKVKLMLENGSISR